MEIDKLILMRRNYKMISILYFHLSLDEDFSMNILFF
jgi:hypothetical protein